jgi:hypothetical protein
MATWSGPTHMTAADLRLSRGCVRFQAEPDLVLAVDPVGAWTFYEATPPARQEAMFRELKEHAPEELAAQYARGMKDWRNRSKIARVDQWIRAREDVCHHWFWDLLLDHRPAIEVLCS